MFAVSTCGGPILPYRGGRIDALVAGQQGPPEPQQGIRMFNQMFARMGFTASEMIQLVACGHTMGAVRSTDFSNLVAPNPSQPDIPNFDTFDTTTMQFDNKVYVGKIFSLSLNAYKPPISVTEYLSDTTQNPLVITPNTTYRSDLEVFSSDGNVTMQR